MNKKQATPPLLPPPARKKGPLTPQEIDAWRKEIDEWRRRPLSPKELQAIERQQKIALRRAIRWKRKRQERIGAIDTLGEKIAWTSVFWIPLLLTTGFYWFPEVTACFIGPFIIFGILLRLLGWFGRPGLF